MGRRRNHAIQSYVPLDIAGIEKIALEWRVRLNIANQYAPDIYAIYETPSDRFPHINFRTFDVSEFPSKRTVAWAHADDRIIESRADRIQALKCAIPEARWDAIHEVAHIALGHPGNNLYWANGYSAEDLVREKEAAAFTFSFLAPVHLARNLASVADYVTRFRIPHDKAKERKQQVELLVRHIEQLEVQSAKHLSHDNAQRLGDGTTAQIVSTNKSQQLEFSFLTGSVRSKKHRRIKGNLRLPKAESLSAIQQFFEITGSTLPTPLTILALEDREILEKLLSDTNNSVSNFRIFVKWGVGISVCGIGSIPVITEVVDSAVKPLVIGASGLIGGTFAFFQILDRPFGLEAKLEKWARRKLMAEARKRGITRKIEKHVIVFRDGKLQIEK